MFKRLAFGLAFLAWWVPAQVFALGLGNIEMRSALNQPLDARIELLRARDGEVKDLAVALATADTFKRAGIERPNFLTQLKFEVVTNPGGTPYIQVRSAQPITEPFLNFLIEVNWPNGRLLREFTVLVDPPVLTDTPPTAVTAPATSATPATPEGILVDAIAAERARAEAGQVVAPSAGAIEIPSPTAAAPAPTPTPEPLAVLEPEPEPVTRAAPPEADPAAEAVDAFERGSSAPAPAATPEPVAAADDLGLPPVERPTPTRREETAGQIEREAPVEREAAPAESTASGEGVNYGPVKKDETLMEIAARLRRDTGASIPQMMIALLENNPEAFIDNNINNLKRGAVLRLDDPGVALNISKEEAARIADLQWEQFKQQRGTVVGSTPSRSVRPEGEVEPTEARVKLLSPDAEAGGDAKPSAAAASGGGSAARLRRELATAEEALDAQRRETQDMRERVASLEEQISTMKRLIQLKDDQLAAMQNQAAAPAAAAAEGAAPAAPTAAVAAKAAAEPAKAEAPKASIASGLFSDPKLIGLVGVVGGVVVLLIWLFIRRRKMQEFQESILTLDEAASEPASMQAANKPASEDASFMSDFSVSSMEGIQADVNEVDPLSEADVYLAYGRHKQAADLISSAIAKDPARAELKMKLMEIHYAARDKKSFIAQAEAVRAEFTAQQPEMWARVQEMGRELAPDSAVFSGAGAASGDEVAEFDLGDLNLGDTDTSQSADAGMEFDTPAKTAEATESTDDNSLDFDLGDFKLNDEISRNEPAADAEHSLDFDLSAFDEKPATGDTTADEGLDFKLDESEVAEAPATAKSHQAKAEPDLDLGDLNAELGQTEDAGLDFKLDDMDTPAPVGKSGGNVVDFSKAASEAKADADDVAVAEKDIDGELDDALFADVDEVGTKLDLAKAYIDMGDSDGARSILDEVMEEGDDTQKQEAQVLMRQIG